MSLHLNSVQGHQEHCHWSQGKEDHPKQLLLGHDAWHWPALKCRKEIFFLYKN